MGEKTAINFVRWQCPQFYLNYLGGMCVAAWGRNFADSGRLFNLFAQKNHPYSNPTAQMEARDIVHVWLTVPVSRWCGAAVAKPCRKRRGSKLQNKTKFSISIVFFIFLFKTPKKISKRWLHCMIFKLIYCGMTTFCHKLHCCEIYNLRQNSLFSLEDCKFQKKKNDSVGITKKN